MIRLFRRFSLVRNFPRKEESKIFLPFSLSKKQQQKKKKPRKQFLIRVTRFNAISSHFVILVINELISSAFGSSSRKTKLPDRASGLPTNQGDGSF
jgi:hypothetical protein